MRQGTRGYLQNFKSIHTKLKEIDLPCAVAHLVVEIQAIIMMRQGSVGYVQNFKSIRQKIKIFILGEHFFGGAAVNIKS